MPETTADAIPGIRPEHDHGAHLSGSFVLHHPLIARRTVLIEAVRSPAPVSARVVLPARTMTAGSSMSGRVVIENRHPHRAIQLPGDGHRFLPGVQPGPAGRFHQAVPARRPPACAAPRHLPGRALPGPASPSSHNGPSDPELTVHVS